MTSQDHAFPQMMPPRVHGHPVSQPGSPRHANIMLEGSGRTPRLAQLGSIQSVGPLYWLIETSEHLRCYVSCVSMSTQHFDITSLYLSTTICHLFSPYLSYVRQPWPFSVVPSVVAIVDTGTDSVQLWCIFWSTLCCFEPEAVCMMCTELLI